MSKEPTILCTRTPISTRSIDRFKLINDSLGHQTGDILIRLLAERIKHGLRDCAVSSRVSGDKFIIVAALVKNAEIAMYRAKEAGEGRYTAYDPDFQKDLQRMLQLENQLRAAINDGCDQLEAYFQPKVNPFSGEITQCEALMRWNSDGGLISPGEFIPQAEKSGLIVPMTWLMIGECCKRVRAFSDAGMPMQVCINIPAQVLVHKRFLSALKEQAEQAGIDVRCIDIEITESALLSDAEDVNFVFQQLHAMGVEISVDDFGTGYSSLSYLNRLSVDRIKIDRSFVMDLSDSSDSRAIVRAIIAMAESLQMKVTAEGVETPGQYKFLRDIGCDEIQGFLVSRPVPAGEYMNFIAGIGGKYAS